MQPPDNKRAVTITDNKVSSGVLLGGRGELVITHNGEEYRLRVTGNDKLILTK